jgi:hypothetical protein
MTSVFSVRRWSAVWLVTCIALLFATPAAAQEVPTQDEDQVQAPRPGVQVPRPPAPDTIPRPGVGVRDRLRPGTGAQDTAVANGERRSSYDPAQDTIFQALKRMEGFTAMEYQGDSATYHAETRVLRLFGDAEVTREGDRLTAKDTIVYREATQLVEAYGRPTISGQAEPIEGEVMFYHLATRRATVRGARTRIAEAGATWWVRGNVTAEGTDRLYASKSIFTTDDREEPAYYFEADDIKVIRDRILVGRPARLYFKNVPVFWLPFVVQDLTRGRRSGLLAPEFSINDVVRNRSSPAGAQGTGRQISNLGFYWAINDYMDAQVSGAWRSGDYTGLRGALRYRWTAQFLDGSLSYSQFWRDAGVRELIFYANNSWRPDERTNVSLNANFASSRFLREITTDYFRASQNITSNASFQRRFDWGMVTLDGNRTQSLLDDRVEMTLPRWSISPRPITLFQAATPDEANWYSNSTLTLSASGSRAQTRFGLDAPRTRRDEDRTTFRTSQGFTMGNLGLNSSFNLNRLAQPEVGPAEEFEALPRLDRDDGRWDASLSYRVALIGETSVSPTLAFSQDLRRDTLTAGSYMTSPTRMSLGASLNTSLYGFLPGVGAFSVIRHKITPAFSYSYVPEVNLTPEQERIFGPAGGRMQNNLSLLSLNQTFEARLREPTRTEPALPPGADTLTARGDTATAMGLPQAAQAAPPQAQKVTLLSLNTSGFNYDFAPDETGRPRGFTTRQVSNTISSDYLRGLQISMTHELFDASTVPIEQRGTELGRFSPRLSSVSTQFSLGQDTPFLRWLGMGRRTPGIAPQEPDSIPTAPTIPDPLDPTRRGAFTSNPQAVGRGPWRLDVGYNLSRPRTGGTAAQDLRLGMSFAPTANWAVNWYTNYSIEDSQFGGHQITLRRDLYRWEANFNFSRTVLGATSFDVLIRLKDLPDLKVDYREDNIGANRFR